MATTVKRNATVKKETTTAKADVKKQLAKEAVKPDAKQPQPEQTGEATKPAVNLDERMNKFEKLRGIAGQRERLNETLGELTRFNYNQDGSSTFYLKDSAGLEFKTTNSNLIKLVTSQLQKLLEHRKTELEKELIEFEL